MEYIRVEDQYRENRSMHKKRLTKLLERQKNYGEVKMRESMDGEKVLTRRSGIEIETAKHAARKCKEVKR